MVKQIRVSSFGSDEMAPLVLHCWYKVGFLAIFLWHFLPCSAGVGRTGAFIVIDAMLERIKHERTVDIYGHVTCLRAQRNYMVKLSSNMSFST